MPNDYFSPSGAPATGGALASSPIRANFTAIESAFDKLPDLTSVGNRIPHINAGSTAIVTTSGFTFDGTTFTAPALDGTDTTDSTSSTTGALKTAGGVGIAKALNVGTKATIGATTYLATSRFSAVHATANQQAGVFAHTHATTPLGLAVVYSGGAPNNAGQAFIDLSDSGGQRGYWYSNGGIANYSANNVNLSTKKAKQDIEPLEKDWSKVKAIRQSTQYFKYKDASNKAEAASWCCSPMAEDVEAVFPEYVVPFAGTALKGVREQPLMWEMFGNMIDKIEELAAEVSAIKGKV